MLNKEDLKLLNTSRGLEYLLQSNEMDFTDVVERLRYEKHLIDLQAQLIQIQNKIVSQRKRVIVLVEGREFAGKGDLVHVLSEHLNPRSMRIVALSKPTPRESEQWYFRRYIKQLPERGEIAFFDRSWYNRAVVEPVNGFCSEKEYKRFMAEVNHFERMLTEDGIWIIKIYLSISRDEQRGRIEAAQQDPLSIWRLTDVDLKALELWDTYSKFEKKMFKKTNTATNPWFVFRGDDKRATQIMAFEQLLSILAGL